MIRKIVFIFGLFITFISLMLFLSVDVIKPGETEVFQVELEEEYKEKNEGQLSFIPVGISKTMSIRILDEKNNVISIVSQGIKDIEGIESEDYKFIRNNKLGLFIELLTRKTLNKYSTNFYDVNKKFLSQKIKVEIKNKGNTPLLIDDLSFKLETIGEEEMVENKNFIEGYSNVVSVSPKDYIEFKVHSPESNYSIEFIRFGKEREVLKIVSDLHGKVQNYSSKSYKDGADWKTSYKFKIPENWKAGMYAARLFDKTDNEFYVTFIVKDNLEERKEIVVLASTNTWQAYNTWGGASFYRYLLDDGLKRSGAKVVNTQRPNPFASPIGDVGHLANAEKHILSWLEINNYEYNIVSDMDLHHNPKLLDNYSTLILNTHSEYWTSNMYDGLEAFLKKGGNLMYLSGNGVYWKTVINGDQLEVRKDHSIHELNGEQGGLWLNLDRPESSMTGIHYTSEGYDTYAPYEVKDSDHWIFNGTNLKNGDLIGEEGLNGGGASGHETDKINQFSPNNLILLAKGTNEDGGGADMVYYDHPGGGGVFSTGSITFGGSLVIDSDLKIMVNNLLNKFLSNQ
jgi:N,N-dimethylformamidase